MHSMQTCSENMVFGDRLHNMCSDFNPIPLVPVIWVLSGLACLVCYFVGWWMRRRRLNRQLPASEVGGPLLPDAPADDSGRGNVDVSPTAASVRAPRLTSELRSHKIVPVQKPREVPLAVLVHSQASYLNARTYSRQSEAALVPVTGSNCKLSFPALERPRDAKSFSHMSRMASRFGGVTRMARPQIIDDSGDPHSKTSDLGQAGLPQVMADTRFGERDVLLGLCMGGL